MWPFTSTRGWRTVKGREGFTVEMPCKETQSKQPVDRDKGALHIATYRASPEPPEPAITCQLTVRSGPPIAECSDTQTLRDWKEEFAGAMAASGVTVELVEERALSGADSGGGDRAWEIVYRGSQGRTTIRVRLVRRGEALFILSAIGSPDRVDADGMRFLQSFVVKA